MPVIGKGAKSLRKKNIFSQNVSAMATLDSVAPTVTGTLGIGQTTFAVPPSLYNQNPTAQVGAISVYRNGQIQARCVDNDISKDGNYIEVAPVSGTLFSTIQFKQAPVNEADNIAILTNGLLVPRPSSSQQAEVETLGAKMDKVVEVLSDVSGQPESYFQTAPSQVDLTNFGTTVTDHEGRIASLEVPPSVIVSVSSTYTPTASAQWYPISGNYIDLPANGWTYAVCAIISFSRTTSPAYTAAIGQWSSTTPGSETTSVPTAFSPLAPSGAILDFARGQLIGSFADAPLNMPQILVKAFSATRIYLNANATMSTPANSRISMSIYAYPIRKG